MPAPDHSAEKESGIESESDSGNETISSENVDILTSTLQDFTSPPRDVLGACGLSPVVAGGVDVIFDGNDIDAFIASVTIPPPPADSGSGADDIAAVPPPGSPPRENSGESTPHYDTPPEIVDAAINYGSTSQDYSYLPPPPEDEDTPCEGFGEELPPIPPSMDPLQTFSEEDSWEHLLITQNMQTHLLEDDFAQYVIPPPPDDGEKRLSLGDIPIVPPVDLKSPSPLAEGAIPQNIPQTILEEKAGTNHVENAEDESSVVKEKIEGGASIKERIQELKGSFGAKDKDRPLNLMRPKEPPPAPPTACNRSISEPHGEGKRKQPPPPPRRQSSYDSSTGSTVTSPVDETHKLSIELNLACSNWQDETRSADSSPLHRVAELYAHSRVHNSMGTLPRLRPGRGVRNPPPPPPRRSSMPGSSITETGSGSSEGSTSSLDKTGRPNFEKYKLPVGRRDYENVYTPQHSSGGPTLTRKAHSMVIPKSAFLGEEVVPEEAEVSKSLAEPPTSETEMDADSLVSASLQELPSGSQTVEALRLHHEQLVAESSSLFDPVKPESKFNSFKSKLKAYVSPSVHRKQYSTPKSTNGKANKDKSGGKTGLSGDPFEPQKSDYLNSGSSPLKNNVGRSNTFNTSSTIPRPYGSPRNSPGLQRHSSFSEREKVERTPSTFKTFLGDKGAARTESNISRTSSSSGSAPPSPRKSSPCLGQSVGLSRASSGSSNGSQGSNSPRVSRSAPGTPRSGASSCSTASLNATDNSLLASLHKARAELKPIASPELKVRFY